MIRECAGSNVTQNAAQISSINFDQGLIQNINGVQTTQLRIEPGAFQDLEALGFTNIETVDLDDSYLESIVNGTFKGLGRAISLSLNNVSLTELPSGAFHGMPLLQTLSIVKTMDGYKTQVQFSTQPNGWVPNWNPLCLIHTGAFEGLKNLNVLRINNTHCRTDGYVRKSIELRKGAFAGLTGLSNLQLINNHLSHIDAALLPDSQKLQTLILTSNRLAAPPTDLFKNTPSLLTLFLDYNWIQSITANAFEDLSNLDTLQLNVNSIRDIAYGAFYGLLKLKYLHLELNSIKEFQCNPLRDKGIFSDLPSLIELIANNNAVSSLDRCAFVGLEKTLQKLDLSNNAILSLSKQTFFNLTTLKTLLLCKLGSLSYIGNDAFSHLNSLLPCGQSSKQSPKTAEQLRLAQQHCDYHYEGKPLPTDGFCMSGHQLDYSYCRLANASSHQIDCTCQNNTAVSNWNIYVFYTQ